MMRALALMLMASPAFAQTHEWGTGTEGPSSVTVAPSDYGLAVTLNNRLVSSLAVVAFQITVDGFVVSVVVSGHGVQPDIMTVTPPSGYWCDPCEVSVAENATGTVDLWPEVGA